MSAPAAIAGSLVDARNVSSHKSFRLVIDIPAEQAMLAIEAFGWPTMAAPVAVAIARMTVGGGRKDAPIAASAFTVAPSETASATPSKRAWSDLSLAQQAGIRCSEPAFQKFLRDIGDMKECNTADDAATYVRFICGVGSRRDIENNLAARAKWVDLETRYQVWLTDPTGGSS